MKKLFISPYQLRMRESGRPLAGALLAFEFESGLKGYSDFLPRPDLSGEAPLKAQLEDFKKGHESARLQLAQEIAWHDASARRLQKSLFFGLQVPESHFFVESSFSDWDHLKALGVSVIKAKLKARSFPQRLKQLKEARKALPNLRWRFDLNGSLKPSDWPAFKRSLHFLWDRVEFIEDPFKNPALFCPPSALAKYAEDWIPAPSLPVFRIVKPSRDRIFPPAAALKLFMKGQGRFNGASRMKESLPQAFLCGSKGRLFSAKPLASALLPLPRLIFTHSFETCLGQAAAAWLAGRFFRQYPRRRQTGAFTAQGFMEGPWIDQGPWSPIFTPPSGFGLGYGRMLGKAPWKPWI